MSGVYRLREQSSDELVQLQDLSRAKTAPAAWFRRYRLIGLLAGGYSIARASEHVGLHYTNAHKWVRRLEAKGLDGPWTGPVGAALLTVAPASHIMARAFRE